MNLLIVDPMGGHEEISNPTHIPRIGELILWKSGIRMTVEQIMYDYDKNQICVAITY